ncbi:MAG: N-acetyl-1-D-myo-inositol-2-amino-2-deoxy-alpha-D-glucopyranoside deacetylase [Mycobacteriales bacterium]
MSDATLPPPPESDQAPASGNPRRLLLVHAHPDDETIGTGATMAKYAADGALVTLVTCTLGEEGEILLPGLEHLAADQTDGLGQHRIGELATAMEALGIRDHRFLGGPGRYRDSGMMGTPQNDRADCFWQADLAVATADLVRVIREVRPQVLVTYDENGGYGHPDHIQANRVATAARERAADASYLPELGEAWQIAKLYHSAIPKSFLQAGIDHLRESGESDFFGVVSADDLPFGVPDEVITTEVDARDHLDAKVAAMRAHATQIAVDGPFFALSNNVGQKAFGIEHYVLVDGECGPGDGPQGRETDLFGAVG